MNFKKYCFVLPLAICFSCGPSQEEIQKLDEAKKEADRIGAELLSEKTADSASNILADNAPKDSLRITAGSDAVEDANKKLEPVIAEALKTLPAAKKRYLKGLKEGEHFYLTINLKEGKITERVFVYVMQWKGNSLGGKISNEIAGLKTYKNGQVILFNESDIVDWTITKPDGTEEGNYIGKFIDAGNL